jgi:hypothetical protein
MDEIFEVAIDKCDNAKVNMIAADVNLCPRGHQSS